MANYYTNFSTMIDIPEEHRPLVERLLKGEEEPFEKIDFPTEEVKAQFGWQWEAESVHGGSRPPGMEQLWIYSDGSGDVADACEFASYIQKRFQLEEPFVLEWSNTCDKPRLDAFGGGVCVVHRGKQKFVNTGMWADRELKKIKERKEREAAKRKLAL